jgi:RTX calcium-binding nonapeptide repeat (4 copies)
MGARRGAGLGSAIAVMGALSAWLASPAIAALAVNTAAGEPINYLAEVGERNTLRVSNDRSDPSAVTVRFEETRPGVTISPSGECTQGNRGAKPTPSPQVVVCPAGPGFPDVTVLEIDLFDRTDILRGGTFGGIEWDVNGGNDTDILHGGSGADTIRGGSDNAADELYGEQGSDYLSGGGGNDSLIDNLLHNEMLGGQGHDLLRDGSGNSKLYADSPGAEGRDHVIDDGGHDDIRTGAGNDEIEARDGRSETRIWCGSGEDTAIVDHRDPRAKDCEHEIKPRDRFAP